MREKNKRIKPGTIITSHVNADFDAIGAMLAAQKRAGELGDEFGKD